VGVLQAATYVLCACYQMRYTIICIFHRIRRTVAVRLHVQDVDFQMTSVPVVDACPSRRTVVRPRQAETPTKPRFGTSNRMLWISYIYTSHPPISGLARSRLLPGLARCLAWLAVHNTQSAIHPPEWQKRLLRTTPR